jgi:hypothetical protein
MTRKSPQVHNAKYGIVTNNYVQSTACKSVITSMETVRNFAVTCEKFNVEKSVTYFVIIPMISVI